jgi:hypothetical protein
MSELYRHFGSSQGTMDFSDQSLLELYNHESYGTDLTDPGRNGFSVGKRYLNLQVTMWKEDIYKGMLFKSELYEDENYPHWWLDSIFKDTQDLSPSELKHELETCERLDKRLFNR